MAAPTAVLTQTLLQGTHYSSSLPWQAGATTVQCAGLLADADASLATNTGTFAIEASFDGGRTFGQAASIAWAGGTDPIHGGPNLPKFSVGYAGTQAPPTHVRVRVDLPAVLSVGATLAFA